MTRDDMRSKLAAIAFDNFPVEVEIGVCTEEYIDEDMPTRGNRVTLGLVLYCFSDETIDKLEDLFHGNKQKTMQFCQDASDVIIRRYYKISKTEVKKMLAECLDRGDIEDTVGKELDRISKCINEDLEMRNYIFEKKNGYPKYLTKFYEEIGLLHNEFLIKEVFKRRCKTGNSRPFKVTSSYGIGYLLCSSDINAPGGFAFINDKNNELPKEKEDDKYEGVIKGNLLSNEFKSIFEKSFNVPKNGYEIPKEKNVEPKLKKKKKAEDDENGKD